MSYTFQVKADSKAAAKAEAERQIDLVIASQAVHARDREAALANAGAVIDLVSDEEIEGRTLVINMSGSIGWDGRDPNKINGVGINCSVHLA